MSRARGEGSIYFDARRGAWTAQLRVNGRKVIRTARNQRDAVRLLSALRAERDAGRDPRRLTLARYLDRWLARKEADGTRTNTLRSYRSRVAALQDALGPVALAALEPGDVERMTADIVKSGRAPRTAAHHRAVLANALNDAIRERLLSVNVAELAKPPRIPRDERVPPTPDEVRAVFAQLEGDPWAAAYRLAATVGMRQGEVLALRWTDVDLEAGALRLRQTVRRAPGRGDVYEPTKSGRSRPIPLPAPLRAALYARAAEQAAEAKAGEEIGWANPRGLVFTDAGGRALSPTMVLRRLYEAEERAGVIQRDAEGKITRRFTFHDLRHAANSVMADAGVPSRVRADILGHSHVSTTDDVYTHSFDPALRAAAEHVARAYGPTDGPTGSDDSPETQ